MNEMSRKMNRDIPPSNFIHGSECKRKVDTFLSYERVDIVLWPHDVGRIVKLDHFS